MATLQLTFGVYLLILLAIGLYFYFTTETQRLSEYLLADRDVGTWPIAISEVSSVASGWTFFAWVGVGFTVGLNGLWFSVTMIFIIVFMYRYVGSRFRRQSESLGSITIADHLSLAVEDERLSFYIRVVATLSILVFMGAYIGAQIIAVGEAMDTGVGIDYLAAVAVGGVVVGLYTTLGGFNASIWTDVFQGILIFVAAVTLPVLMIMEVGGWSVFLSEAAAVDDAALLDLNAGLAGQAMLIATLAWVTFAFGTIGQPHSLMRLQAIRSERHLSGAAVIAVAFQSLRLTVPLLIGMAGRIIYGSVEDPESVAMVAIVDFFPAVIAGILLAAIISAILSTSDSMLLVASSDLTRFYEERIDPEASDTELILLGRGVIGVLAIGGIALAFLRPGTIFEIIEFAYVGLGATFGLPLLFLLFWERTTGEAVLAGIITGLVTSIGNLYLVPDLFPILVWPLCLIVIVGVTLVTAADGAGVADVPEPTPQRVDPADD
ncbi:sodium/proline symporter [Natronorubrum bangense]|uniref:Sodium/proline symporter n=2 Tax=Natronorubrum bangense TaxID=61858 RepID=L9WKQ2_9EURY|nr:sodium/proline symporter [Natronorubrum bangense]ELY49806.1 sodium/proline symporter [Natronorubrum bangense JCM 10635]QCC55431.1 sodium/proline symporter [Natronorubrum bangense]